jgi:glyceraldehyde-3-phosphate dehydrogenase (NADP+)
MKPIDDTLFPLDAEIPPDARLVAPVEQDEYLLGGALRRWDGPRREVFSPVCVRQPGANASGAQETIVAPATEVDGMPGAAVSAGLFPVRIGSFPDMTAAAALEVIEAAVVAWGQGRGPWPTLSVTERIRCVEEFAFRMTARREEVVRLLVWEIGKTRRDAEREFGRTLEYIAGTVNALKDLDRSSSRFLVEEGILAQVRRAPLGVVLCLGPYNYPLNETFTTLIPALIMGNTVVMKPPKLGVLLHRPLLDAFRDSFPPGVVNTVYGEGKQILGPLMASGKVDCLAFIGSHRVADLLKKQHPRPHRLRCVLGLDAKNPAIILPDADLDLAARECLLGALSFNGQRCTALKILFVHESVAASFLTRLEAGIDALQPGMPWESDATLTPLPEPGKVAYLRELVADAVALGARVTNPGGGQAVATYFHPAVIFPVDARMRAWREEQFGPVIPVATFRDIEEPVRYIVESPFGQQVSLFGGNPATLSQLIDPLVNQVCRVNLNSQCQRGPDSLPFTGRKDSAEGTLSMSDALRVFSIRTLVAAKDEAVNRRILGEILRRRSSTFLSTDFIF